MNTRKYGHPLERFVDKIIPTGRCWVWKGAKNPGRKRKTTPIPRGVFNFNGKAVLAHRWIYQQLIGPIPNGLELDHLCRNPSCVRPSHLQAVTHSENVKRGTSWHHFVQLAKKIQNCPQGHPYNDDNTYIDIKNGRHCKMCGRERTRKYDAANRKARALLAKVKEG